MSRASLLPGDRAPGWLPGALVAVLLGAFLVRLSAAMNLSPHVDEAASILAAQMVADKGVPRLPSGTLYLQGATLSYLLAPLRWIGRDGIGDLTAWRLLSVVTGTAAVYAMYRLGDAVTRSSVIALAGAVALAVDPVSVRWSGLVRMYAPLQWLSLVVVWLFIRSLFGPASRRGLAWLVLVFWMATFTHIGAVLLLPGAVAATILHAGRGGLRPHRPLLFALGLCAVAPVAVLGLNRLVSAPGHRTEDALPGLSFVGDSLLSVRHLRDPAFTAWVGLFDLSRWALVVPILIVGATGIVLFGLARGGVRDGGELRRLATLALLYWIPVLGVAGVATSGTERYLLNVHPLGLLLVLGVFGRPALAMIPVGAAVARPPGRGKGAGSVDESPEPARLAEGWHASRALARRLDAAATSGVAIVAVVALAAGLRVFRLEHLSLWLDEGFTVLYARLDWSVVTGFHGFYSPHPPLYFVLAKLIATVAPETVAGRLISVVAGSATVPVLYVLMARIADKRAAFVAALVLAVSPLHLYYSQEARMYALVVLLVAVAYLALVSFYRSPRGAWAVAYAVVVTVALYADYSAGFALLPQALLLAAIVDRYRRRALPVVVGAVAGVLAYVPWMVQVIASVDAANRVERRDEYLGAAPTRVLASLLSVTGLAGDGDYFQSTVPTLWHRWPELRALFLLPALAAGALGVAALRRRSLAFIVVGCLIGTVAVAIWVSLISPSYAERTILTATLAWAALVGIAFARDASATAVRGATVAMAALLVVTGVNLGALYAGAAKQPWRPAAKDVALVSDAGIPLLTYSYGGVGNALVDVYQPGVLDRMRVITIRDGELEGVLSNGTLPDVGITRRDVLNGRLADFLPPGDPANGALWYLYYQRDGLEDVAAGIAQLGFQRVMHREYPSPRYRVFLDLYARPGSAIGQPVADIGSFSADSEGWVLPPDGADVRRDLAGREELTLENQTVEGRQASRLVTGVGAGVYEAAVEIDTDLAPAEADVVLTCERDSGAVLATARASEVVGVPADGWAERRVAVLCPPETARVRLALRNAGVGTMTARSPRLSGLPIG